MTARVARASRSMCSATHRFFRKATRMKLTKKNSRLPQVRKNPCRSCFTSQGQRRGQSNRQSRLQPGKGWPGQDAEQDPGQKTKEDFQQIFHIFSLQHPAAPVPVASLLL